MERDGAADDVMKQALEVYDSHLNCNDRKDIFGMRATLCICATEFWVSSLYI